MLGTAAVIAAGEARRGPTRMLSLRAMTFVGMISYSLYLVHWPVPAQDRYVETWRTLRELRDEGRVRAVGTCNFHAEHLQRPDAKFAREAYEYMKPLLEGAATW